MSISINLTMKKEVLINLARLIGYTESEIACIQEDEHFKDELSNILEETIKNFYWR